MKRYEAYKDSGIEWIGEIPEGWEITKCKNLFEIKKRIVGYDGPPVLSITQHGIVKKDITSGEGQLANSYSNYQWVKPGDFAMNHMDLLTGWVDCSEVEGVTSPDYRVFTPRCEIDRRYYRYIFQHCYSAKVFYGYGQGVSNFGRWRLPADEFKSFLLPSPSLQEQKQIADYLDEKTVQIDALIKQTEKSIELLEEYRKAVISEAVTKGLDPDVPMKDSGIEWIGEIPEHWDIVRLKNLGTFDKGKGISRLDVREFGCPAVRYGELYTTFKNTIETAYSYIDQDLYSTSNKMAPGDLLFSITGEIASDIAPCAVNKTGNFLAYGGDTLKMHIEEGDPSYLSFSLNAEFARIQKERAARGEIIVHISSQSIRDIIVPVPPIEEQIEIANHLEAVFGMIDLTISRKHEFVAKLREYRRSLISEAVTGKFKVPGVD